MKSEISQWEISLDTGHLVAGAGIKGYKVLTFVVNEPQKMR